MQQLLLPPLPPWHPLVSAVVVVVAIVVDDDVDDVVWTHMIISVGNHIAQKYMSLKI